MILFVQMQKGKGLTKELKSRSLKNTQTRNIYFLSLYRLYVGVKLVL